MPPVEPQKIEETRGESPRAEIYIPPSWPNQPNCRCHMTLADWRYEERFPIVLYHSPGIIRADRISC